MRKELAKSEGERKTFRSVFKKIGKKVIEADMNEILGQFVDASQQLFLELKKYREKLSN